MTPPVVVTAVASNGFTIFADVYFEFAGKRLHLRALRLHWTDDTYWDLVAPRVKVPGGAVEAASLPPSWSRAAVAAILEAAQAEGIAA